jgi:hypothetical protein
MPSAFADFRAARRSLFVEFADDVAIGVQAFRHFADAFVEQFRQLDIEIEQAGPRLIADAQQIAEPLR